MSKNSKDRKVLRTTKTGSTYWYYPQSAERWRLKRIERDQRIREGHETHNGGSKWNTIPTSVNVIKLDSKTDEHYLRYVEKKKQIREEYDRWSRMSRKDSLEYYSRISHLLFHDQDFQYYIKESLKLLGEKDLDEKYDRMNLKLKDYDGSSDY